MSFFRGLNMAIKRADLSRYLVLQRFGGLHLDLDVELRRPVHEVGGAVDSKCGCCWEAV